MHTSPISIESWEFDEDALSAALSEAKSIGNGDSRPKKRIKVENGESEEQKIWIPVGVWRYKIDVSSGPNADALRKALGDDFKVEEVPVRFQPKHCEVSKIFEPTISRGGHMLQKMWGIFNVQDTLKPIFSILISACTDDPWKELNWIQSFSKNQRSQALKLQIVKDFSTNSTLTLRPDADGRLELAITTTVSYLQTSDYSLASLKAQSSLLYPLEQHFSLSKKSKQIDLFHKSVHVPKKDEPISDRLQPELLDCVLLPFQKRSVKWMLQREGVSIGDDGAHVPAQRDLTTAPACYRQYKDANGKNYHFSHLFNVASYDMSTLHDPLASAKGGILSEEMGLGKTVELISLVLLHRRPPSDVQTIFDDFRGINTRVLGTTLIITPVSILQQWKDELSRHAPDVKVLYYQGLKRHDSYENTQQMLDDFNAHDVVITTYNVFSSEVHYTEPPPERNFRHEKKYKFKLSPLIQGNWWRICLDEAQMIENGISNAAHVAFSIPRQNAWLVTGTPIRSKTDDLVALMRFLRVEPFVEDKQAWSRLRDLEFSSLLSKLCIRHTKEMVQDELNLPEQRRVMVTLPFTAVEQSNYDFAFQSMLNDCHLTADGSPADEEWEDGTAYLAKMRNWLVRLRQICLHARVGVQNKKALGGKKVNEVQTLGDLLDAMIQQQFSLLKTEEKRLLDSFAERGRMKEFYKERDAAIGLFKRCLREAKHAASEVEQVIKEEEAANAAKRKANGEQDSEDEDEDTDNARAHNLNRLRGFQDLIHMCHFFLGDLHFQARTAKFGENITDPEAVEMHKIEVEHYDAAKAIRKELFKETHMKARKYVDKLQYKADKQKFTTVPEVFLPDTVGGIELQTQRDNFEALGLQFNEQAALLNDWREKLVALLTKPLLDEEDDVEGNEFEESVKQSEEIYAYMDAIKVVLAERTKGINGQENELVKGDIERTLRAGGTTGAKLHDLLAEKEKVLIDTGITAGSMRDIIARTSALRTKLNAPGDSVSANRQAAERALVEEDLKHMRDTLYEQQNALKQLEVESNYFRQAINARIDFHRQLQAVSNNVEHYDSFNEAMDEAEKAIHMKNDEESLRKLELLETTLTPKIVQMKGRLRYLQNLLNDPNTKNTNPECLICSSEFEIGLLTDCGHYYCQGCLTEWYKIHRKCPQCRKYLTPGEMHKVTFKPKPKRKQKAKKQSDDEKNGDSPKGKRGKTADAIYKHMDELTMDRINRIPLGTSLGSKIDAITRHLLWLRETENLPQSIIFSQWADVLHVFQQAFTLAGIRFVTAENQGAAKFKSDPTIDCFLLHAKSQSSGLTLVNATHVFLCEPLVNPRLELQAISRVHRIGQTRPTTVWCYVIEGTVEQTVLNVATRHRLELIGKTSEYTEEVTRDQLEIADSRTARETDVKIERNGEVVGDDDVWECLFGSYTFRKTMEIRDREFRAIAGRSGEGANGDANGTPDDEDTEMGL